MLFQGVAVEFYTQAHRHHSPLHVFHPHGATRSGLSRCIHGDRLPSTGLLEIVVSTLRSSPQYSRTWSYAARALRHPHCSNHELHSPTRHEVVALESIMSKGVRFCQLVFQTDRKHGRLSGTDANGPWLRTTTDRDAVQEPGEGKPQL